MARTVGLKIAEPKILPGSRLSGMNTQQSIPNRAACADTLLARFPVEAPASTEKPNSTARVAAIDTTRSLYDNVGWLTVSSLIYSSLRPRRVARRSQRTSGVKPEWKPVRG